MTKRNWDKADYYEQDPARVIDVPQSRERWVTPEERRDRVARLDEERRTAVQRSEQHDRDLLASQNYARICRKEDAGEELDAWGKLILRTR
jgi:hypothetical protein